MIEAECLCKTLVEHFLRFRVRRADRVVMLAERERRRRRRCRELGRSPAPEAALPEWSCMRYRAR